jgi:capsular polysaccharide biosynthesis protein
MRSLNLFGREAVRRAWIVVLCVVVATVMATAVGGRGRTVYVANATMLVPQGRPAAADPGRATEAQRLAASYAGILGEDARITTAVGDAMGLSPGEARNRITVTNRANTAVIDVRVAGDTPVAAGQGLRALIKGVTAETPVSDAVAPGTLVATRQADEGARSTGDLPPPLVGAVLGLVLGVVAAIALARADRRADHVDDLVEFVPCPVTPVPPDDGPATTAMLAAVGQRWHQALVGRDVVLLPVGAAGEEDAEMMLRRLRAAAGTAGVPVRERQEHGSRRSPEDRYVDVADEDERYADVAVAGGHHAGAANGDERHAGVAGRGPVALAVRGSGSGGASGDDARRPVHDPPDLAGNGRPAFEGDERTIGPTAAPPGGPDAGPVVPGALYLTAVPPPPIGLPRAMDGGHIVLVARQSDRITAIAEAEVELANFGLRPAWLLLVQR